MSWNSWSCRFQTLASRHAPRERVSWNRFLELQSLDIPSHAPRERVSWNEATLAVCRRLLRHAPRERVSWNGLQQLLISVMTLSRSTWACELKFWLSLYYFYGVRHAPRERVSWNAFGANKTLPVNCHAPRERVSWNLLVSNVPNSCIVSRSTWACELKFYGCRVESQGCSVTLHVSVWVEIIS